MAAQPMMQGGNQVTGNSISGGFAILGSNIGNVTFNSGPSSEKKCLRALFVTNPADDRAKHISFKGEPVRSVFGWIIETKTYKSWADPQTGSALLWISGGPGMGKTMLSIFLSEELEQLSKNNGLVLYYFCEGRDPKRNTPVNILRGLIYSLVKLRPPMMKYLLPDYEVQEEALFGPDSVEPLWRIFMNMVNDPNSGVVYCVIDGLDECAPTSLECLEHILKKFSNFFRSQTTVTREGDELSRRVGQINLSKDDSSQPSAIPDAPKTSLKVALISREYPQCLLRELSGFQRVQLGKHLQPTATPENTPGAITENSMPPPPVPAHTGSAQPALSATYPSNSAEGGSGSVSGYGNSLSLYIEAKIDALDKAKGYGETYRNVLKQKLEECGDGTFLWVDMAVEQLTKRAPGGTDLDLSSLPSGTDGMYCLSLLQIPQDLAAMAAFIIRWVAVAFRPLKIKELSALIYFMNDHDNGPEIEEVRKAINSCGLLLTVSEEDEVKLGHQTAKDFLIGESSPLLSDPRIRGYHVDEKQAHAEIAATAISYVEKSPLTQGWWHLTSFGAGVVSPAAVQPAPELLASCPLLPYTALFWPNHLNLAPPGTVNLASPLFDPENQLRTNWFKSVWESNECKDPALVPSMSLLGIAAYFDILELAQVLSRREDFRTRIDKKNLDGMKPVFIAAERGSTRTFVFLLDCGADQTSSLTGENLFQFACRKGQLGLVRILIARGANVNEYLQENLAVRGAQAALRHAPKKVVDLLMKTGKQEDQDTNDLVYVNNGYNIPPLHCALTAGHEEVARLLLDHGADINHRTTTGWTAMHFAAWSGQVNLVQLVLQRTGNAFPLSSDGWSPLHCAAWRGKTGAGECLLDQGIGVDLCTKDMQTALHLASFRGHHEMAKSLLRRRANPEAKTSKGMTPLHLAASEENDEVVKVLLEHGVNRESKTNRGETALKIASGHKHSTTVQLLTTYRPAMVAHPPLSSAFVSGFGIPTISPASNPSPHGFTGQIQNPKPSYFNQSVTSTSGSPAYSGPVLSMSPTGSSPLATSTPYTGTYTTTSPGSFSTHQPLPAHGMNPPQQTGYQQPHYPVTSLASPVSVYSPPLPIQQPTFPPATQPQATTFMPQSHLNIQTMQQSKFSSPPQQPVQEFPQHNAPQPPFSPMSPLTQASHAPYVHSPGNFHPPQQPSPSPGNFQQAEQPQYNGPQPNFPPTSPLPPASHVPYSYPPGNFQQAQQQTHYMQPATQPNQTAQQTAPWAPQPGNPALTPYGHPHQGQQQHMAAQAAGQGPYFPPPPTPVAGQNQQGLFKGILSRFGN